MPEGKGITSKFKHDRGVDGTKIIDWLESGGRVLSIYKRTMLVRYLRGESEFACTKEGDQFLSISPLTVLFCHPFGAFGLFDFVLQFPLVY